MIRQGPCYGLTDCAQVEQARYCIHERHIRPRCRFGNLEAYERLERLGLCL